MHGGATMSDVTVISLLANGLYGALGSVFLNGSDYWKKTTYEEFLWDKFLYSLASGAVVGFGAGLLGMPAEAFMATPAYAGISRTLENFFKALFRKETILKGTATKVPE
jgi:hypothetical protein